MTLKFRGKFIHWVRFRYAFLLGTPHTPIEIQKCFLLLIGFIFAFFFGHFIGDRYDASLYSLRALAIELQKAEKKFVSIIKLLTVRVATVDMHKGILPGTTKLETTPWFVLQLGKVV